MLVAAVACGSPASRPAPNPYLTDATYRRKELVRSLVNPENDYSALRLAHYETGGEEDWAELPEWNPPAEPVRIASLGAGVARLGAEATGIVIDADARGGSRDSLLALGERAFFRYPMQLSSAAEIALESGETAERYGLWVDAERGVGGLVRVALPDGTTSLAETCSTCHAGKRNGSLVVGAPNERLDWGALVAARNPDLGGAGAAVLAWGPGRLDVTTPDGTEPCRIADLRPTRWLTHLHQDATVTQQNVASLAIRIETLVITAHSQVVRPPREIALGLALFVRSLADSLPDVSPVTPAEERGSALFREGCIACHTEPGLTGPPVAIEVVGTDPALGRSVSRGTGMYRVPSLHGVASRGPLLHDGTVPDLAALFDPTRLDAGYAGRLHGEGSIQGHAFGLDLDESARGDLLSFLGTL